jgi:hypothetical protein
MNLTKIIRKTVQINQILKKKSLHLIKRSKKRHGFLIIITLILTINGFLLFKFLSPKKEAELKLSPAPVSTNYLYQSIKQDYKVYLGSRSAKQTPEIKMSVGNSSIGFKPEKNVSDQTRISTQDQKSLVYKDVYPGIDFIYTLTKNGVKEEIKISSPQALSSFTGGLTFNLNLSNAVPKKDPMGNLTSTFVDPTSGNYLFHFEKPFMVDSGSNRSEQVKMTIISSDNQNSPTIYGVKLEPDPDWLKTALYPVMIDPTVIHDEGSEFSGTFNRTDDIGVGGTGAASIELYEQELPADINTVALWHMNESADNSCSGGQDVCDVSGNNNHGTFNGHSAFTTTAKLGAKATTHDGTDDYISLTSQISFTDTKDFTLEIWYKGTDTSTGSSNLGKTLLGRDTSDIYANFGLNGGYAEYLHYNGSWLHNVKSITFVADNKWHHITLVHHNNETADIYIDGKAEVINASSSISNDSYPFRIDYLMRGYSAQYTSGIIDEVRISNIARTPEEIKLDAQKRPYGVYTSSSIDLGTSVASLDSLQWSESITGPTAPEGWTKVKPVTIDNSQNTNTLTNYQIKLTVPYDSNMQTDFDDLRFTNSSGTNLDYWIEEKGEGVEATVWVEVDSITASSETTIFMFYGNAGASAASNGNNVFEFFDDFSSGTLDTSKWNTRGTVTYAVGEVTVGVGAASSDNMLYSKTTFNPTTQPVVFEANVKHVNDTAYSGLGIGFWHDPGSTPTLAGVDTISGWATGDILARYPSLSDNTAVLDLQIGSYARFKVAWTDATHVTFTNGLGSSATVTQTMINPHYICFNTYNNTAQLKTTLAFVRKYTSPEPTVGLGADIEFQTRTSANNSTWEEWKPTGVGSTAIDSMDSTSSSWTPDYGNSYTKFLLHADGTDGSTTFLDSSVNPHSVTANGNAQIDTAQKEFGTASTLFDGTGDYLTIPDSDDWYFGTGDFTIDCWVRFNALPTNNILQTIFWQSAASPAPYYYLGYYNDGGTLKWYFYSSDLSLSILVASTVSTNTWYHLALVRYGNIWRIFQDGVQIGADTTNSGTMPNIASVVSIGAYSTYVPGGSPFNGWIDEFRVSKGIARWTANFTPPTSPYNPTTDALENLIWWTAKNDDTTTKIESTGSLKLTVGAPQVDANTVDLWHLDETGVGTGSTAYDSSTNNNHGTATGTTLTEGFYGKARSFNGSSDYILLPASSAFDLQRFTIEAWVNPTTIAQNGFIFEKTTNGAVNTQYSCFFSSGTFYFRTYNSSGTGDDLTFATSSYFKTSQWNHLACTYDGSTKAVYVNGVLAASKAYSQTMQTNPAGTSIIGAYGSGTSYFFNGKIDEVRISNVGRSAEEIAEAYRAGRDHRIERTLSSTDLSSQTKVPFYVASDRPGSYLETYLGEGGSSVYSTESNMQGLWHFDEGLSSGNYFKDASDNGYILTETSGTIPEVTGRVGKAVDFEADDTEYLAIADASAPNLDITGPITLSAWIKRESAPGTDMFVMGKQNHSTNNRSYWIRLTPNSAQFGISNDGTTTAGKYFALNGATDLSTGTWFHIVGTYDQENLNVYVNGVVDATPLAATVSIFNGNAPFTVGVNGAASTEFYDGLIDEVMVLNRALSADEIRQIYQYGLRTHQITVDYSTGIGSSAPTSTSDVDFNPTTTTGLYVGDTVIVREKVGDTTYIMQGEVASVSSGEVTVASWSGTAPPSGYTTSANVFKWQREYWDLTDISPGDRDAITKLGVRVLDGSEGFDMYLDDFESNQSYLTDPEGGESLTSTPQRYFQYRAILTTNDTLVSPSLNSVTLNYTTNNPPSAPDSLLTNEQTNPTNLGVGGTSPFFSAIYNDPDTSDIANKYQIQVDDDLDFNENQILDNGDTVANWTSSDNTYFIPSQDTGDKQEGTGSIGIGATSGYDPDTTATYFFTAYNSSNFTDPASAVDTSLVTYSDKTGLGSAYLQVSANECDGTNLGEIKKVEILARTMMWNDPDYLYVYPIFSVGNGTNQNVSASPATAVVDFTFDITNDTNAPSTWSWTDIQNLDLYFNGIVNYGGVRIYAGRVKVTYTPLPKYDSLNDTLTRDLGAGTTKNLSGYSSVKFWIKSSRTGTYLQFGLGENSWNDNTSNITINSADTWEQKTIDISGIASGDKDAIRYLGFKVTNADTDFTIKFDDIKATPDETDPLIWDSGSSGTAMSNCNQGDRCSDISYGGSALSGGTTYYWRIKYWDDDGDEGAWSTEEASFSVNYTPLAPNSLLTEGQTNPSGIIDTTPEFSAIYNEDDNDPSDIANKYQIQVDDDSGFGSTLWDSGSSGTAMSNCNQGDRCSDISYGGNVTDLQWGAKYYWRIKFWDDGGFEGDWSTETAYFTMNIIYPPTSCMIDDSNHPEQTILKWADNTSFETGYEIQRSVDSEEFSALTTESANSTSSTDNTTLADHSYKYRVRATSDNGDSNWCESSQVNYGKGTFYFQ